MRSLSARYELRQPSSSVATNRVLRARDRWSGALVAVKLAPCGSAEGRAIHQEAELLSDLAHPHLVQAVDYSPEAQCWSLEGAQVALVTRWVDGEDLATAAEKLSLGDRLTALAQIAGAVAYLHRRGVLHLDIKPANCLAGPQGAVLLDLGAAQRPAAPAAPAGGTPGFAAPEVAAGRRASTSADIYSLGALLHHLVTGTPPAGPLAPGDAPPAIDGVSPGLAALVAGMLRSAPSERPRSIMAVLQGLADLGVSCPPALGDPPFSGRGRELELLAEAVRAGEAVTVRGPPGSGRARLVRHYLWQRRLAGRSGLDLGGGELPARPEVLAEVVGRGPVALRGGAGAAAMPAAALRRWRAQGLVPVVLALDSERPTGRSIDLPPLDDEACHVIGRFLGTPGGPALRGARLRSGGHPGLLIEALRPSGARTALSTLPAGIPPAVVEALPEAQRQEARRLVAQGRARLDPAGALWLPAPQPGVEVDDSLRPAVRAVLAQHQDLDPLWSALVAARLGDGERARALFEAARSAASDRRSELEELAQRLDGHGPARVELGRIRLDQGRFDEAAALLEGGDDALLARALRRGGRLDEVEALVLGRVQPTAELLLELATARAAANELELASQAHARAVELGADALAAVPVALTIALYKAASSPGEEHGPALDRLAAQLEAGGADAATLLKAGWVAMRLGRFALGDTILAAAARAADRDGDARRSAAARLNRASCLQGLGRRTEARELYTEARQIAQLADDQAILLHIVYSVAELEMEAGNLSAAEVGVDEFRALALDSGSSEAVVRGAMLTAGLALVQGQAAVAVAALRPVDPDGLQAAARILFGRLLAEALIETGHPDQAIEELDRLPPAQQDLDKALLSSLRGQACIALGRQHLATAVSHLPQLPDPTDRARAGSVLLAAAGEGWRPEELGHRRRTLDQAAGLLRGDKAALAATLRDRLLEGPGGSLDGIAELIDSVHDPLRFPVVLARVVSEALGANRVLIMARLPGLGRQHLGFTELSGADLSSLGSEVMERLQGPEDYWLAGDAFEDRRLRDASRTIRTFEIRSLVAVAIPGPAGPIGALYVDDLHRTHRFTMDDVALLRRLAAAVANLLPLFPGAAPSTNLFEPQEAFGVILARGADTQDVEAAVSFARHQPEANLLITGPTGVGKSFLADRIAREAFGLDGVETVALRKGDSTFLVGQLIGARKGEFTGATTRTGAIQRALAGNRALFLDEIQALDDHGQQTLLPLLDLPNRRFGGLMDSAQALSRPITVILGTNAEVQNGAWAEHFRSDLWFRMAQAHIHLPPLCERGAEVVYRYLAMMLVQQDAPLPEVVFERSALQQVTSHSWPGNLRELQVFAARAAHRHRLAGRPIGGDALAALGLEATGQVTVSSEVRWDVALRRRRVMSELQRCAWSQKDAAAALGMTTSGLSKFLRRNGLIEEVRRLRRRTAGGG